MFRVSGFLCVVIVAICNALNLHSQEIEGSGGTDFILAFPPALHSSADSVTIVIYSTKNASGTIEGFDVNGNVVHRPFVISDPRGALYISFACKDLELRGNIVDTLHSDQDQSEKVLSRQSLRIRSDANISVAALCSGPGSADAFTVLPLTVVGKSYVVQSYNSSPVATGLNRDEIDPDKSTPSQFVIVATENATDVTITLKTRSSHGSAGTKKIRLNQGESYLLQAAIDTAGKSADLSGSTIMANKPVAVFAGQQSASVPSHDLVSVGTPRSFIAEQMIPMEHWGSEAIAVPLGLSINGGTAVQDYYRVFAAENATEIHVDGERKATINPGEFYEASFTEAHHIRTSSAAAFMQYKASTDQTGIFVPGNASMLTIPALEHFKRNHSFVALQLRVNALKTFNTQYMLVVAQTKSVSSILLDDEPITTDFVQIPGTLYSYRLRKIADGVHTLSCDEPCSVQLCGVSPDRCYSYTPDLLLHRHAYQQSYVRIPDMTARSGDTTQVQVFLDSMHVAPMLLNTKPKRCSFDLRFNATVLTPADPSQRGVIRDGLQTLHFDYTVDTLKPGQLLASVPMICGLGDAESSAIEIDSCQWFNESGDKIAQDLFQTKGYIHVSDVWSDKNGIRLVNPQPGDLGLSLSPNPVNGRAFITLSSTMQTRERPQLKLYSSMGVEVLDLTEQLKNFNKGTQIIFDGHSLQIGVYYLRFSLDEKSIVNVMIIE